MYVLFLLVCLAGDCREFPTKPAYATSADCDEAAKKRTVPFSPPVYVQGRHLEGVICRVK